MNKMKKLMALACVMVLALCQSACAKENNKDSSDVTVTPVVTEAAGATETPATKTPEATGDAAATKTPEATGDAAATKTPEVTGDAAATKTPEVTGDAAATETVYPVTVKGSDGAELVIEEEPEKIISVGPNITEIIYSLGAEEKLVGRTNYCDYPEQAAEIESIGTIVSPDIEKIISLEPDLVIGSTHFDDDSKAALEKAGIEVIYLYEEYELTGVYTMIETLGTVLNANMEAVKAVEDMKAVVDTVTQKIEGLEPVSIYYVVGFGEYGEYTAGGNTFVGELLTMAGGANIAEEVSGWSYSLESLIEADPEVIVLAEYNYDAFTTTEPYSNLSAVKNGRVHIIDTNMLDRQCVRNAQALYEIAQMLHPDVNFAE